MHLDTYARTLAKTISWRAWASATTCLLVLIFTRRIEIAFTVGAIEVVVKMVIYWLHERIWNKIRFGRREITPAVIWLTGLPASGKTSIAKFVVIDLQKQGVRVEHLDGEDVRQLFPETGFTEADRAVHVRRVGHLASMLEKNGIFVVASLVSPDRESRDFVRQQCKNFVEVYVSTPLETCELWDRTELYDRAHAGKISNVTGIDVEYQPPIDPEIRVDGSDLSPEQSAHQIIRCLGSKFIVKVRLTQTESDRSQLRLKSEKPL